MRPMNFSIVSPPCKFIPRDSTRHILNPAISKRFEQKEIKLRKNQRGIAHTHVEVNCNAKQIAGIRPRGAEYIMHARRALSAACTRSKNRLPEGFSLPSRRGKNFHRYE